MDFCIPFLFLAACLSVLVSPEAGEVVVAVYGEGRRPAVVNCCEMCEVTSTKRDRVVSDKNCSCESVRREVEAECVLSFMFMVVCVWLGEM